MDRIGIHISSESENRVIQSFLFSHGFSWAGGRNITHREIGRMYGDKSVLFVENRRLSYSDIKYAERQKETVLSPSDFIAYAQDNLIPREPIQ